jgi:hypothetical protein
MADKGRIITGARARLLIDGKKVGYATQVTVREEIDYVPAEFLDNIEVEEFTPDAYRCSGSCAFVRISGETLKSQGFFPKTGATSEQHLRNILLQKEVSLVLEDNKTNKPMETIVGVKFAGRNLQVGARGIAGHDCDWVGRRVLDESESP